MKRSKSQLPSFPAPYPLLYSYIARLCLHLHDGMENKTRPHEVAGKKLDKREERVVDGRERKVIGKRGGRAKRSSGVQPVAKSLKDERLNMKYQW